MSKPLLAIVMPAYNEEGCIHEVVASWTDFLRKNFPSDHTKLIVVNDGSRDKTGEILDSLKPQYPELVVQHKENGGHGKAVVAAYKMALEMDAEWVFQTDSDDQFESKDLLELWQRRNESDFILGYRKERFDAPIRLVVTRILRMSINLLFGTNIKDSNIPFRLIRGSFLRKLIAQLPDETPFAPNIFLSVMARRAGQQLFNIPVTHKDRHSGEVSIRKMKLLKVCVKSFKELAAFRKSLRQSVRNIKSA